MAGAGRADWRDGRQAAVLQRLPRPRVAPPANELQRLAADYQFIVYLAPDTVREHITRSRFRQTGRIP